MHLTKSLLTTAASGCVPMVSPAACTRQFCGAALSGGAKSDAFRHSRCDPAFGLMVLHAPSGVTSRRSSHGVGFVMARLISSYPRAATDRAAPRTTFGRPDEARVRLEP